MKILRPILFILLISSCRDKVDRNRIPGLYIFANIHFNPDTIEVYKDGSYYHHKIVNGKTLENRGNWSLNSNGSEVMFENFSFMTDNFPKGNWYTRIRVEGEQIQFIYSSDSNDSFYKKIDNHINKP